MLIWKNSKDLCMCKNVNLEKFYAVGYNKLYFIKNEHMSYTQLKYSVANTYIIIIS